MAAQRCLDSAQHEAAHLVVGVALGLRVRRVVIEPAPAKGWTQPGYCWFNAGPTLAESLMFAAGIAWERALGHGDPTDASIDAAWCRSLVGPANVEASVRAAGAMLAGLGGVHARVTRALLERDLGPDDIAALARGERPSADDGA